MPSRSGFSLVELLTVIAIISVLMTVASIGLGGLLAGKGVSTGVSTTEAVFEEARTLAVGKRTNAAVLVSIQDPTNADTYLRRLVVAYKEIDPVTNAQNGTWTLSSRGVTLPDKIYYSRVLSKQDHKNSSGELPTVSLGGGNVKKDYQGVYFVYEFNAEGICTTPGASFVIGTGVRSPSGTELRPRVINSAKRDFGGFVIWRNGSTSIFRDPLQIGKANNLTYF
ncbi:MAG: prepilin-type N-terminal cleavage/methylation domain-containing protein [Verrucomicrobia bacterium]|nr:prepilin-type N-terminal cleavage/methylation domain-containing protein [Verrucomicrobiota bacterium]